MSTGTITKDGYYLQKSGERVSTLLSRHYIVPTLDSAPTSETLSWNDGEYIVEFRIGEFVRVEDGNDYVFYRLKDINDGQAIWADATSADMSNYYTKEQIDDKFDKFNTSGNAPGGEIETVPGIFGGCVELISEEEFSNKKESGDLKDNVIYFIVVDGEPYELYIGQHLIGKKGEIENLVFPYSFPLIF